MEIKEIERLTARWRSATRAVISLDNPDLSNLRTLFKETYALLDRYSKEALVPKQISGLLLEMHDFGWWMNNIDNASIHNHYRDVLTLVCKLNKFFLTRDVNTYEIKMLIDQI